VVWFDDRVFDFSDVESNIAQYLEFSRTRNPNRYCHRDLRGLTGHLWVFKKLFEYLGQMLAKAPLVKAIYGSLKDLSGFIFPADAAHRRLVLTAGVVGSKEESDSD